SLKPKMSPPCALCKGKNPHRTHVFPQNSRAEVQHKWVKALGLPQNQEDAVLAEMRQLEQKGNRPRWCTFHFEYDSAGIHFPKYFDPEEGKTAQGWKEEDDEKEEEEGPSTREKSADEVHDRSSTPNEPRRSSRKRTSTAAADTASTSSEPLVIDKTLQKILLNAGIVLPGVTIEDSPPKATTSVNRGEAATSIEKTLQSIIMEAGLPVPETLQAKTGVLVDEGKDDRVSSPRTRPTRPNATESAANTMMKSSITVADAKRLGTFVPGKARGGATLSSPKMLKNPLASKFSGDWPKVIMPKPTTPKLPSYCYNHNTMEKYDESDALRNFKMPCPTKDCRSELTVIMNRARALEDQFDDLSSSVLKLVQMYRTKNPIAFRPPQSLATIQGRAASVAGPVYGAGQDVLKNLPVDSLAVQERREKRLVGVRKEPERLLTDDDLASTVRRRVSMQEQSVEDEDEDGPELDDDDSGDDDWKPSSLKRSRVTSGHDADTASEASPPRLDLIE
ncbi:hypothetical protein PENTCL1PPCAC_7124, partial [Pristionchus entomophagus]